MTVQDDHARLHARATALAGDPGDLMQRASAYLRLYAQSDGNNVFPLIAAHGAFWARGYFRMGERAGAVLSLGRPSLRTERRAALERFAATFKEINRRVCVEASTCYHLTELHADAEALAAFYPRGLIDALHACHAARRQGVQMSDAEKRNLFEQFFRWEQEAVVGAVVSEAFAALDWPLVAQAAMRPAIRFEYFPRLRRLWFTAFDSADQRIEKGLQAFDIAARVGWAQVRESIAARVDPARAKPRWFSYEIAPTGGTIPVG